VYDGIGLESEDGLADGDRVGDIALRPVEVQQSVSRRLGLADEGLSKCASCACDCYAHGLLCFFTAKAPSSAKGRRGF
jgi:hypothetical protein